MLGEGLPLSLDLLEAPYAGFKGLWLRPLFKKRNLV